MSERRTIGLVGTGCLGRPLAERLLDRGFSLLVYNRTREKAVPLEARGARLVATPAEAARGASVLVTVLGDDAALEGVALGPDGTVAAMPPGATHLEMSTGSAALRLRLADALARRGAALLDAPVLGSGPQAREGTLVVMVGGEPSVVEKNRDVLEAVSKKIVAAGPVGAASRLKIVANQFIVAMMLGFAQGMTLARKAGLEPALVMEVLGASALRSPFYEGKLRRLETRDYRPNFPAKWMLKDIDLMLAAGAEHGVPLPTVAAAREAYVATLAAGLGAPGEEDSRR